MVPNVFYGVRTPDPVIFLLHFGDPAVGDYFPFPASGAFVFVLPSMRVPIRNSCAGRR